MTADLYGEAARRERHKDVPNEGGAKRRMRVRSQRALTASRMWLVASSRTLTPTPLPTGEGLFVAVLQRQSAEAISAFSPHRPRAMRVGAAGIGPTLRNPHASRRYVSAVICSDTSPIRNTITDALHSAYCRW